MTKIIRDDHDITAMNEIKNFIRRISLAATFPTDDGPKIELYGRTGSILGVYEQARIQYYVEVISGMIERYKKEKREG